MSALPKNFMTPEEYLRQGEQWILTDARGKDAVVVLPSIDCKLALGDVYTKVAFEEQLLAISNQRSAKCGCERATRVMEILMCGKKRYDRRTVSPDIIP